MYITNLIHLIVNKKINLATARHALSTRPNAVCGRDGSYCVGVDPYDEPKASIYATLKSKLSKMSGVDIAHCVIYVLVLAIIYADVFVWRAVL